MGGRGCEGRRRAGSASAAGDQGEQQGRDGQGIAEGVPPKQDTALGLSRLSTLRHHFTRGQYFCRPHSAASIPPPAFRRCLPLPPPPPPPRHLPPLAVNRATSLLLILLFRRPRSSRPSRRSLATCAAAAAVTSSSLHSLTSSLSQPLVSIVSVAPSRPACTAADWRT